MYSSTKFSIHSSNDSSIEVTRPAGVLAVQQLCALLNLVRTAGENTPTFWVVEGVVRGEGQKSLQGTLSRVAP